MDIINKKVTRKIKKIKSQSKEEFEKGPSPLTIKMDTTGLICKECSSKG